MATKHGQRMNALNTQAARRQTHSLAAEARGGEPPFYDQHRSTRFPNGRPWWCETEIMADGITPPLPCTPLIPDGWHAPFDPDQIYQDYSRVPYGRVEWRWDRMLQEDKKAFEDYYLAAAVIYHERGLGVIEPGQRPHFAVRAVIGAPTRSPKIAEALIAGDPWLLGLTPTPNENLQMALALSKRGLGEGAPAPVKPEAVLQSGGHDLKAMIDAAVQAALEADRAARKAAGDRLRAGKAARKAAAAGG